jgi:hypothetical protein
MFASPHDVNQVVTAMRLTDEEVLSAAVLESLAGQAYCPWSRRLLQNIN